MSDLGKLPDNVVALGGYTTLDIDPNRVLEYNKSEDLDRVLIIMTDKDGVLAVASSYSGGPDLLWDLEKAKQWLMEATE